MDDSVCAESISIKLSITLVVSEPGVRRKTASRVSPFLQGHLHLQQAINRSCVWATMKHVSSASSFTTSKSSSHSSVVSIVEFEAYFCQ